MKKVKTLLSILIGIPSFIIFCSEMDIKYFGVQLLAGAVLVGVLAWNGIAKIKGDA